MPRRELPAEPIAWGVLEELVVMRLRDAVDLDEICRLQGDVCDSVRSTLEARGQKPKGCSPLGIALVQRAWNRVAHEVHHELAGLVVTDVHRRPCADTDDDDDDADEGSEKH